MSDQCQIQHSQVRISLENLKEFLFNGEKKYVILNPKHNIWLCVNDSSATELVHKIFLVEAAVVINTNFGVKTEYYHYTKKIKRDRTESEVETLTEGYRSTFEQYYKLIQKEVYTKHYAILAEALGEDRAKILIQKPIVRKLTNVDYFDQSNITTHEERDQIKQHGINVGILEYA